jgi:D-xylose transport system permease protein
MRRLLAGVELDARTTGMFLALGGIWIALDLATDGVFLSARNLYNLAVQSSAVGVMAMGMVLVIVSRHIDLSVGSVLGFTGMVVAALQVEAGWAWPLGAGLGLGLGAAIGAWQGYWIAYRGVPAFVVTLAGLLVFRGAAWLVTDGRTVAPLDPAFQRLGGGLEGSIGTAWSWTLGALAVAAVGAWLWRARSGRRAYGVPMRPRWAELLSFTLWCAGIAGFVAVMNAYPQPRSEIGRGIPVPVLILIGVAIGMSLLARRTRFGRYVFALGGSPVAAALAGIEVRRVTLKVFALMGLLCGVSAILTTARLGAGANSMGTLAELNVIAAAVIGGTSLAGGAGTIVGAILGAVVMQSLENGMVLLGVSSAARQVAIGLTLIAAVWLDSVYRRSAR